MALKNSTNHASHLCHQFNDYYPRSKC